MTPQVARVRHRADALAISGRGSSVGSLDRLGAIARSTHRRGDIPAGVGLPA